MKIGGNMNGKDGLEEGNVHIYDLLDVFSTCNNLKGLFTRFKGLEITILVVSIVNGVDDMLVQMITASEYCDSECYTSLSHGLYPVNWGLFQLHCLFYKMEKQFLMV